MQNTIAVVGEKGSGKDSLAKRLQDKAAFDNSTLVNLKFAEPLHSISLQCFGAIPYNKRDELVEVCTQPNSKLAIALHSYITSPSKVDAVLTQAEDVFLNHPECQPQGNGTFLMPWRLFAQLLGTEIIREVMGSLFFVNVLKETRDAITMNTFGKLGFIITDARFQNELQAAGVVTGVVRDTTERFHVDPNVHDSEKIGQSISVCATFIRRGDYTAVEAYTKYLAFKGITLNSILESRLDADGDVYFVELWCNAE